MKMAYENNFFIGSNGDPLLSDNNFDVMREKIDALENLQKQKEALKSGNNPTVQSKKEASIWEKIDAEIEPLTDSQKNLLFNDEEYRQNESELMQLIQEEMINIARPYVENSKQGNQILEAQYKLVKEKKNAVIAEANKEVERFNAFKLASRTNPDLTYAEFIKQLEG